eukprot:scaffold32097_cov72-Skeletonema_dohrnii-CCMP3373.AAC.1
MVLESIAGGRLRCLIRSPKRCGDVDMPNQCLSRVKDASLLSWPTVMGHYKQLNAIFTRVLLAAVSDASSGHLRRCGDVAMPNQCLSRVKDASMLSWPTVMGHYKKLNAIFTA